MATQYLKAVSDLMKGRRESAVSQAREIRSQDKWSREELVQQQLLSIRVAIKEGNHSFGLDLLDPERLPDKLWKAECLFLRGICYMHLEKYGLARENFLAASLVYEELAYQEKLFLSRFNALVAAVNAGAQGCMLAEELADLEQDARVAAQLSTAGLCVRQKSYFLFEQKRYAAAADTIERFRSEIELHCPRSDFHLSLVHLAHCYERLGEPAKAKTALEYLPDGMDARVVFPRAVVEALLAGSELRLADFPDASSYWRKRYEECSGATQTQATYLWNRRSFLLQNQEARVYTKIKPGSLEGKLLQLLERPRTKGEMLEALWPAFGTQEHLDQRFHRLVHRVNQKTAHLIAYNGERFFLRTGISRG